MSLPALDDVAAHVGTAYAIEGEFVDDPSDTTSLKEWTYGQPCVSMADFAHAGDFAGVAAIQWRGRP